MTVGQLESEMDTSELIEWAAFFKIEHDRRIEAELAAKAEQGAARAKARPR